MVRPVLAEAGYILPLKWNDGGDLASLCRYLEELSQWISVLVVDGSPAPQFSLHAKVFPPAVRHCRPHPLGLTNGKVEGVLTGVQLSAFEYLVIADDDVRYTCESLERVVALLENADAVRPQNYFADSGPWHARWDTARTLINRALGSDYPGTLAIRKSTLQAAGGYSGDVLFENLELIRTIRAAGGREIRADDLYVPRICCSVRHFWGQRVRQAYDDFAQPGRFAAEAALLPLLLILRKEPARLAMVAAISVMTAEIGRRRAGGARVFKADAALWAPLWVAERAVSIWLAVGWRMRGGVPYAGKRLLIAGHSQRRLRRII
ncbi:glycosyltransferase family 2 protein [Arthrobacter sp. 08Y14]|uniref:glycosyltransferase n=1 Tax=Arthrobacter sp. 08Y14 TaxID=2058885 RepID=UPI0021589E24|nr:glycosyltransferase family 2 protein [Arthrobacter sp. 08Y14]